MATSWLRHLSCVSLLTFAAAAQGAGDSYLDALKAEAKAPARNLAPVAPTAQATPRTDDQVQMEKWLELEFVGTWVFYQKLSDHRKAVVYQLYRDGAPIEELRVKINELLKQ